MIKSAQEEKSQVEKTDEKPVLEEPKIEFKNEPELKFGKIVDAKLNQPTSSQKQISFNPYIE